MKIGKVSIDVDKNIKSPKQYSKVWMTRWQMFVMFWVSVYNIVDIYYSQAIHANNVITLLIGSVVGSIIPYFAKSFLETMKEKEMQYKNSQLHSNQYDYGASTIVANEYNNNVNVNNLETDEMDEVG